MAFFKFGTLIERFTSTGTTGGTTTLLFNSTKYQIFTGSSNQTVMLPNATTMVNGEQFIIENTGTGTLTVYLNDGITTLTTIPANTITFGAVAKTLFLTSNASTNGTWNVVGSGVSSINASTYPKLAGDVTLVPGTGMAIIQTGQSITFNAASAAAYQILVTDVSGSTLGGAVDGSNAAFTTSCTPSSSPSVIVVVDGLIKYVTTDFTVTGSTINFVAAPAASSTILAIYTTQAALNQNDLGLANGTTSVFSTKEVDDMLVSVAGLVAQPGVDYSTSSGYINFFAASTPEANQRVLAIFNGLGACSQQTLIGSGTTWTFSVSPTRTGAFVVCVNGRIMDYGVDYTVLGTTVTFGTALVAGQIPYIIEFNS